MKAASFVVLFLIVAAAAIAIVYLYSPSTIYGFLGISDNTSISGVSLEINSARQTSCFGSVVQALPGFSFASGSMFNYSFNLTDSCPGRRNITSILVLNPGFAIRSVNPQLPYETFNGNRVPFTVQVQPPSGFHGGVMSIQVNAT